MLVERRHNAQVAAIRESAGPFAYLAVNAGEFHAEGRAAKVNAQTRDRSRRSRLTES